MVVSPSPIFPPAFSFSAEHVVGFFDKSAMELCGSLDQLVQGCWPSFPLTPRAFRQFGVLSKR